MNENEIQQNKQNEKITIIHGLKLLKKEYGLWLQKTDSEILQQYFEAEINFIQKLIQQYENDLNQTICSQMKQADRQTIGNTL